MICPKCNNENRPGVAFCEKCGSKLPTEVARSSPPVPTLFCGQCGKKNREGVQFCEFCGVSMVVSSPPAGGKKKKVRKNLPPALKKGFRIAGIVLGILIVILIGLSWVGKATQPQASLPILLDEPAPLVVVQGIPLDAGTAPLQPGQFSIQANDKNGVKRIEVYSDGQIVAAKNIDPSQPNQQVVYSPSIETLPAGEHEVLVRVYDQQGQVSQTSAMPVIIDPAVSAATGPTEPLVVEDPAGILPPPTALQASVSAGSKNIQISWGQSSPNTTGSRVYARWPGASAPVLVADLPGYTTSYILKIDRPGTWQVYVTSLDAVGREGSLADINVFVPDPEKTKPAPTDTLSYAVLDITTSDISVERLYAYIRLGGTGNRYQRLPANPGEFLNAASSGQFDATVPLYGWPTNQPLPVDVEVWGWSGATLQPISTLSKSILATDYPDRKILLSGSKINASILFQTQVSGQEQNGKPPTFDNAPRIKQLPPPANLRMAFFKSDCELVASTLGSLRNLLRDACRISISLGTRNFLVWDWPPKNNGSPQQVTEKDITGFEIKFSLTDADGKTIGEKITSLPFPQARGYMRDYSEVTQPVDCGIKKNWYIRTVGPGGASDWVYAGEIKAKECVKEYPPYNGCGGQSDKVPDLVPDLIFESSCNAHDQCYVQSWSGHNKVYCDNVFLKDMLVACVEKGVGLILPKTCSTAAFTYYEAVNLVGRFFYEGSIHSTDCLTEPAVDPNLCLLGTSPEILNGAIDIGKTAYNAGETIVKSGYSYTKDGAVYLGKKTMAGLEAIGNGISGASSWVYDKVCFWCN